MTARPSHDAQPPTGSPDRPPGRAARIRPLAASRRPTRAARVSAGVILGSLGLLAVRCGGLTAGDLVKYEAAAAAVTTTATATPARFTTATGWTVALDTALVLLGPVYLYGGGERADTWGLPDVLGPGVAYAHPADATFDRGPVLGDVLDQYVVDLLDPNPTSLGIVPGVEGTMATMELHLHPPGFTALGSPLAELERLGGHTFVLEGTARRGGTSIPFAARGHLEGEPTQRVVESIEVAVELDDREDRPGRLVIHVRIDEWFRFVDFDRLEDRPDSFAPETVAGAALRRGIRSRFAYGAEWRTP